ncbi:MAG: hypothetical protein AAGJ87_09355 [Pseudomonadota bacterium]
MRSSPFSETNKGYCSNPLLDTTKICEFEVLLQVGGEYEILKDNCNAIYTADKDEFCVLPYYRDEPVCRSFPPVYGFSASSFSPWNCSRPLDYHKKKD